MSRPTIDPAIVAYYEMASEETRLKTGVSTLESLRTRELILRHVPEPPAKIVDVGGAAGAYAFWLAEFGYEVRLIDAAERLVEIARAQNEQVARPLASCCVGDARELSETSNSTDVLLMLGPLYHLIESGDRHAALTEAARVLRPGGVLIAAGISRYASALDGLSRELLRDAAFARMMERDLRDGVHLNPTDNLEYFTTAYFHRPEELRSEVADAGFDIEGLYGVEGPGWLLPDFVDRWQDPARREILLSVARALESAPATVGCSAHLLVVGRKNGTV
jgi:ubiquinone/menaquinone biosynthesis C-methylase UbiE